MGLVLKYAEGKRLSKRTSLESLLGLRRGNGYSLTRFLQTEYTEAKEERRLDTWD